ncbi:DUF58 domain-containing protein [Georgenia sp. Z1344]|uniref:DUF58 domain-containing protein n=1 Tax=Georgenia sp. Z1344 TaxID=3416706 RepID=UPI003CEB407B
MDRSSSRLEQIRARLELPTVRRASGLLDGRHRSIFSGHGQDFDDQVEYHPGDDVKDIDWKSSARAGHPIIRRFVRESNLSTVLAFDTGVSMAATSASGLSKKNVAMFAADIIAYVARARGDLVALVAGDSERMVQRPARHGTAHLESVLSLVEEALTLEAPPSDVGRVMDRVLTGFPQRSLVVLITDEARPGPEHEDSLRRLRTRHEVLVVRVGDALPTAAGIGPTADVDGWERLPAFVREDRILAAQVDHAAASRATAATRLLDRRGVHHVVASSEDEVVGALLDLLGRSRRVRR